MLPLAGPAAARPVLVFETPGHTRYFLDDASAVELPLREGSVVMARVLTQSAPDPHLISGQVAADGLMQFQCASASYRQWNVFSIGKDGSRNQVVAPNAARAFTATRPGSFERKLLQAACALGRRAR
jgi:hypothetical protein